MTKKINIKPFCKAWNEAIKPKETWYDIFGLTQEQIDNMKEYLECYSEANLMQNLIDNYEPPKRIKYENNNTKS